VRNHHGAHRHAPWPEPIAAAVGGQAIDLKVVAEPGTETAVYRSKNLQTGASMDRETLNEMVKLKFAARKAGGPEIDLVKLAGDAAYAARILSAIENLPDESLVLLAMTLRDKFGLLAARPQPVAETGAPQPRYLSGARS
jgi:hypothetical protein